MSSPSPDPPPFSSREAALQAYDLFETPLEDSFDRLVELAAHLFGVPTAILSFMDGGTERIAVHRNFDRRVLPPDVSLGKHALDTQDLVVAEDARTDPRFADNPLVNDTPGIGFYASAPVTLPNTDPIGTIAVMDAAQRTPAANTLAQLRTVAALVVDTLEARRRRLAPRSPLPLDLTGANAVALDEEGTIIQTNEAWRTFARERTSKAASAEVGANYLNVCLSPSASSDPTVAARAREQLRAVLTGETAAFEMVSPCHGPDQKRWFHIHAKALDHPQARAVVTHLDITDLKQQERRRRFLETAVEQAHEVVLITEGAPLDAPGPRITYVNPAFTEMTGYEPDDALGRTPRILQGPGTEQWVLRELRRQLEDGNPFEGTALNYKKDGTPYVNHWSIAPVHDEDDTLTHWVSVQRDVTELRRMEKRLLQMQERERRRIARQMHDEMGGLLASLQMAVDAAQSREAPPETDFSNIREMTSDLSRVVRTLTERLHSRVLDDYGLSRALPRLVERFREREGLHVDLHNDLAPDSSLPSLLEKIAYRGIYEALTNVVRHAQTNHAQIFAHEEENQLQVHVLDDGVGFDPDAELAEDERGLLGLKERISRLHGKLDVDSSPGDGTRVSMTLPRSLISLLEQAERE